MVHCAKCSVEIGSKECCLTCVDCNNGFHPACTRVGSAASLTKSKLKTWKCDTCRVDVASTASSEEVEDKGSILEAIKAMKVDINSNIDNKMGMVRKSIAALTEEIKSLNDKVVAVEERERVLSGRCDVLEQVNNELSKQVLELRQGLWDTDQHSRCANIEIQGVPRTTGEDIYEIIRLVATAIGVSYSRDAISIAHRLRLFSKRHIHPPVIVQFVSRSTKEEWISAVRRRRGLCASQLSPSLQPSPVYLNEHLTSHNKELLGCARRLLRERKLFYAGYHNGKVLVKRRDGEEAVRITTLVDLEMYDKRHTSPAK